jgi:hypothetical protein
VDRKNVERQVTWAQRSLLLISAAVACVALATDKQSTDGEKQEIKTDAKPRAIQPADRERFIEYAALREWCKERLPQHSKTIDQHWAQEMKVAAPELIAMTRANDYPMKVSAKLKLHREAFKLSEKLSEKRSEERADNTKRVNEQCEPLIQPIAAPAR